jgi:hypothetical protein
LGEYPHGQEVQPSVAAAGEAVHRAEEVIGIRAQQRYRATDMADIQIGWPHANQLGQQGHSGGVRVITMGPQDTVVPPGGLACFVVRHWVHAGRGNPAKVHGNLPAEECDATILALRPCGQ